MCVFARYFDYLYRICFVLFNIRFRKMWTVISLFNCNTREQKYTESRDETPRNHFKCLLPFPVVVAPAVCCLLHYTRYDAPYECCYCVLAISLSLSLARWLVYLTCIRVECSLWTAASQGKQLRFYYTSNMFDTLRTWLRCERSAIVCFAGQEFKLL